MQLKSLSLALLLAFTAGSAMAAPATFPLHKVRPGQKGYGLTTMKGTSPERFEFEVIGVNRNFLPMMDVILVKSDDPKLKITGFWQGMSGSPLYIDGKVACAFSYGFRFNKVAIGGCTPIKYMMDEGFRKPRGLKTHTRGKTARMRPRSRGSLAQWKKLAPGGSVAAAVGARTTPWILSGPLPAKRGVSDLDPNGLRPSAVPMSVSGMSSPAFTKVKELFAGFPLQPMQAGGTGNAQQGPKEFVMGGSISVQLARGDMSLAGTGTVSYVDGSRVLAFGHPMFQAGELYAPVTSAVVHTVIPSAFSAFVVASPMRELGSLIHDRQSTIMADTNVRTDMIPMTVRVRAPEPSHGGTFNVELLRSRFFTAPLAGMAAMSALSKYLPDKDMATVLIKSRVHISGHAPLVFTDYIFGEGGPTSTVQGTRGLRVLAPLLNNPFAPIDITRIEIDAEIRFDTNFGTIEGLRLSSAELIPGAKSHALVALRQYNGELIHERVAFTVPEGIAGSIVRLEVSSGDSAKLDSAPPKSLSDLLAALRKLLPGNSIAVTLYTASEGVAVSGTIVRDMPASVLDRLNTTAQTPRTTRYHALSQSVSTSKRVIIGKAFAMVKVADRKN